MVEEKKRDVYSSSGKEKYGNGVQVAFPEVMVLMDEEGSLIVEKGISRQT